MTDERDERNPWDPPVEGAADQPPPRPEAQPGGWSSDQTGYGHEQPYAQPPQYPPPAQYGQQPAYGQPQYAPPQQPPAYGQPPAAYGYPAPAGPYGQPYYGPATSGKATTILILGIAGVVLSLGCIGFIPAVIALVLAPGAAREIRDSGGTLTGESQVKAGKIMSWIALGLTALWVVALAVIIAVAVSTDNTSGHAPDGTVRTNATAQVTVSG